MARRYAETQRLRLVARVVAVLFWLLVLLAHGSAAVAAWLLLPGGFPLAHPRVLANRILPALLLASVVLVIAGALRRSRIVPALLPLFPAAMLGAAVAAETVFPESGRSVALSAFALALLFALGQVDIWQRARPLSHLAWLAMLLGAASGAAFVLAQRAPEPSTRPVVKAPLAAAVGERPTRPFDAREPVTLAPWLRVDSSPARVTVQVGKLTIAVEPQLTFRSRSPDRFWTVFAGARPAPPLTIYRAELSEHALQWENSQAGTLRVEARANGTALIDARARLEAPIFSHLNSYAAVSIRGHRRLGLRFSACPDSVVEVRHSEYPFGAPARLAYLDAQGMFRVVQASDAEKGPFTTLAEGRLERGEPLRVDLVELAEPATRKLATIVFRDWSLQVSTELSPTAGWGLPQNAFEFGLTTSEPSSVAYLDSTLAGTSVGRGWDSVGHRAGIYANRMEIVPPAE